MELVLKLSTLFIKYRRWSQQQQAQLDLILHYEVNRNFTYPVCLS